MNLEQRVPLRQAVLANPDEIAACGYDPRRPTPLEIELDTHALLSGMDGVWHGLARIERTGPRCFAFREDGVAALVIPVIEFGELIDVVAVSPKFRRCLLRLDFATMLGHDNLDRARLFDQRPVLVESPMDWLAWPNSVCILDIERDAVEALAGLPDVIYANERLAGRYHAAFSRPRPMPRFWVIDG